MKGEKDNAERKNVGEKGRHDIFTHVLMNIYKVYYQFYEHYKIFIFTNTLFIQGDIFYLFEVTNLVSSLEVEFRVYNMQ